MRGLLAGLFAVALLGACGPQGPSALERPDPLHEQAIRVPPQEPSQAPRPLRPPPPIPEEPVKWEFIREGIFPCSRCHSGGEAVPDTLPAMPHETHLEHELECADCHAPDDEAANPTIPEASVCLECHEDLAEESAPVRAYFESVRAKDGDFVFPRRWKGKDTIFSHARHRTAKIDCAECHGEPSNGPFQKPKSVALMTACVDCHKEQTVAADCETCHSLERQPRHGVVLHHAEEQRGCLDCHNPDDRDALRLASGDTVSFEQSYLLCGQCHGPKLRDWRLGLHGKRTGMWEGEKKFYLCAHCHNPHEPRYAPMKPAFPPVRPEDVR
jgi:hypothetical protein